MHTDTEQHIVDFIHISLNRAHNFPIAYTVADSVSHENHFRMKMRMRIAYSTHLWFSWHLHVVIGIIYTYMYWLASSKIAIAKSKLFRKEKPRHITTHKVILFALDLCIKFYFMFIVCKMDVQKRKRTQKYIKTLFLFFFSDEIEEIGRFPPLRIDWKLTVNHPTVYIFT